MTDMLDTRSDACGKASGAGAARAQPSRRPVVRVAGALACAVLGFLLVAQVRTNETVAERLATEREQDLAVILSDLTEQSDSLQAEITDLRLLLFEFESTVESEELALRNLEQRLDDLRILAGMVPAEGEGVALTVEDTAGEVTNEHLVDILHELRNAGAEALAVNDVRLVASSAFSMQDGRIVLDGQALQPPYRVTAVGPSDTMVSGLEIPGGVLDRLGSGDQLPGVSASVEELEQVAAPPRGEPAPFVFGEPVPPGADNG